MGEDKALMPSEQEQGVIVDRTTLNRIRTSMAMLQQNCEGCATNHYGGDHELFGLPGWLTDTRADLDCLTATLTTPTPVEERAKVAEGDDFDARLSALCDERWKFHMGEPPEYDSPLSQVYDAGIGYAWDRLAELLGVTDYEGGDGSEDYATDVANTARNILVAAGYANDDGDLLTADEMRAPAAINAGQVEALERLRIMAAQNPSSNMDEEDKGRADWQGAYDWFCAESMEVFSALSSAQPKGDTL